MTELLRVREAAEFLCVHEQTVYRWSREGIIPVIRVGGSLRFSREALEAWVNHPSCALDGETDA